MNWKRLLDILLPLILKVWSESQKPQKSGFFANEAIEDHGHIASELEKALAVVKLQA